MEPSFVHQLLRYHIGHLGGEQRKSSEFGEFCGVLSDTGNAANALKPSELVTYCAHRWPEATTTA